MKFSTASITFDIPDAVWAAAGMTSFISANASYVADSADAIILPIAKIAPPRRNEDIPLFRKNGADLERILMGIRTGAALPPIEVDEPLTPLAPYQYRVRNGTHRFYASVAVGFTAIPAKIVPYFDVTEYFGQSAVR